MLYTVEHCTIHVRMLHMNGCLINRAIKKSIGRGKKIPSHQKIEISGLVPLTKNPGSKCPYVSVFTKTPFSHHDISSSNPSS